MRLMTITPRLRERAGGQDGKREENVHLEDIKFMSLKIAPNDLHR
jgi:hypothetical protein